MKKIVTLFLVCLLYVISSPAQIEKKFTMTKQVKATPVKDQALSGTCWSFATTSFIESELIRMGKGEYDLSEMFSVRNAYNAKATNYIRMQGNLYYTQGGQPHDVMNVVRNLGIVPDSVYDGSYNNSSYLNHTSLDSILSGIIVSLGDIEDTALMSRHLDAFNKSCDKYIGKLPKSFIYNGICITPKKYADDILKINPDDYIEITSYTHHPFYSMFCLESRFNWSFGLYYNVPLNEFMEIIDSAITKGFSVVWNGDVSEPTFNFYQGIATAAKDEGKVNEAMRQQTYENTSTKVDHVMHIIGIAKDENNEKYYYVKNSWGDINPYGGFMYLSESYCKLKTVSIMVNKKSIPLHIAKNLNLK
jgi:bleomycin hydrolase